MRTAEALRQLFTNLAAVSDEPAGQEAEAKADDILALLMHNAEAAGRIMLAMGSFTVYSFLEQAARLDPARGIEILTHSGDPIDHFEPLLQALLRPSRTGGKINDEAILLARLITLKPDDAALVLWILANYLTLAARGAEFAEFVGAFIASSLRQGLIEDVELGDIPEA